MMFHLFASSILLSAVMASLARAASFEKENQVKAILQQMETDVLNFRDEIERVYSSRCDLTTLNQCSRSNYNDCSSIYPCQECMDASEMVYTACGDGVNCNAIWSKRESVVRIPASLAQAQFNNPQDADVIESVCYSQLAEEYMVDYFNGNNGNQMYFGSSTGAFRIIPARHSLTCGEYDHRKRPWVSSYDFKYCW